MFTKRKEDSIRSLGEVRLIGQIRDWLGDVVPPSPEGIGDDCAVVEPHPGKQILTTDSLSYGQHFDDSIPAEAAGAKLVKRNLSDIAAMGGEPDHALLSLLSGANLRIDWLRGFVEGIRKSCERHRVALVGGDISGLPDGQFSAVLSLSGHLPHALLLRKGAMAGDRIYVTGRLGGSLLSKHHNFEPRLAEGRWLAQSNLCTALMDLTDGLAKDLHALIPPQCAAYLNLNQIPLSDDALASAAKSGRLPIEHAFCDGEDYELLFSLQGNADQAAFESAWVAQFPQTSLSCIGQLVQTEGSAPYLDAATGEALPWTKGFEHVG